MGWNGSGGEGSTNGNGAAQWYVGGAGNRREKAVVTEEP